MNYELWPLWLDIPQTSKEVYRQRFFWGTKKRVMKF